MDYANTEPLYEGYGELTSGENVRLLAVIPSVMKCSETKSTLVTWPNQLKDKLQRSNQVGSVLLHQISQKKDLEIIETLLECLPKDYDFECCLICFDLKELAKIPLDQISKQLQHLVERVQKAGRVCVFMTPPPLMQEAGKWILDVNNDCNARILAEIRETANGLSIPFIDIYAIWKNGLNLRSLKENLIMDPKYGITHYGHAIIADQVWEAFNNLNEPLLEYNWLN